MYVLGPAIRAAGASLLGLGVLAHRWRRLLSPLADLAYSRDLSDGPSLEPLVAKVANIFVRKSIATLQAEAEETEIQALTTHGGMPLKRTLSVWSILALGIGAIIGAGIFVLTGHAAAANAGPAISLSFILAGVACAFAGLCYSEMASTVPISGSAYTYAYATMGELVAWIIGWDMILEYALGATTVSIGWSGYVVSFLRDVGIDLPQRLVNSPFAYEPASGTWSGTGALLNLPAMLVIAAITALLVVGVHESARVNNVIVVIKVAIVAIFIVAGLGYVSTTNWVTASNPTGAFIPPNEGPGQFGWSGILRGAAVVFFAYIGFDAVSTASQEAKILNAICPWAFSVHWRYAPFSMCS